MPSRVLRNWTDSPAFDDISAEAERLFVRLIMSVDDYGRFHADPRLIRSLCFPLAENLRTDDLVRWLEELSARQMILRYETQGRSYLAIVKFNQRLRQARPKFPPPLGQPETFEPATAQLPLPARAPLMELPFAGTSRDSTAPRGKAPPDSEAGSDSESNLELENRNETETETETKDRSSGPPPALPLSLSSTLPLFDDSVATASKPATPVIPRRATAAALPAELRTPLLELAWRIWREHLEERGVHPSRNSLLGTLEQVKRAGIDRSIHVIDFSVAVNAKNLQWDAEDLRRWTIRHPDLKAAGTAAQAAQKAPPGFTEWLKKNYPTGKTYAWNAVPPQLAFLQREFRDQHPQLGWRGLLYAGPAKAETAPAQSLALAQPTATDHTVRT